MKLTAKPLALLVFVIMFGGIAFSAALNWWNTSNTKVPATYKDGAAAGQYNPADIRGSYLFGDVSTYFNIPLGDLKTAFSFPEGTKPAEYQVKNLESQFAGAPQEIGTASVRMFVAFYNGLPFDLTTGTYLPSEAAAVLKAKGKMTAEQAAYLETHTVTIAKAVTTPVPAVTPQPGSTPAPTAATTAEHTAVAGSIVGKTTFQDLLNWGVSKEAIEKVLGGSMPAPTTIIKDYASLKGLEFSTLKTNLQAEVDKVKK